jgi:hypothetical protein
MNRSSVRPSWDVILAHPFVPAQTLVTLFFIARGKRAHIAVAGA